MKNNLLKQSVIAVLVGGALSGSAFAANTQGNNAISTIVKVLVGDKNDPNNPGLINLVDYLATDVEDNTAAIATHTQRLDNLDNRVNNLNKDLKRGLASQAALNGLFQPYNVGKLNLTAAVGTGYRHNENVATKAGVAFTHGGSATYNVGVNFEW
ncbi:TPA: YadA C-terminal domain-containing protein [Haemophilus influenzae]